MAGSSPPPLPPQDPSSSQSKPEAAPTTNQAFVPSISDAESLGFHTAPAGGGGMSGQPSIRTSATASSDDDSSFFLDLEDTKSLESSITNYRRENGRTYHSYGSKEHYAPNDERAQEQQDISHHFFTLLIDGRLFEAPVENPKRILDLGTGTGIWAMDVADAYPEAQVKGIDLSPIQPTYTPPNCRFEVDDYNLAFVDHSRYDLIHQRELVGTVPKWQDFYTKCFDALVPGGYMDIFEPDTSHYYADTEKGQVDDEHVLHQHLYSLLDAGSAVGMVFDIAPRIETLLKRVGFVNIVVKIIKANIGTWGKGRREKEIGAWNQLRCEEGVSDWSLRRFTSELGWSANEVTVLSANLRNAYREKSLRLIMHFYLITAQKPLDAPTKPGHHKSSSSISGTSTVVAGSSSQTRNQDQPPLPPPPPPACSARPSPQ